MIKWAPYIFVRITICFGAGILWQIFAGNPFAYLPALVAFFIALFLGLHWLGARRASVLFTQLAGITGLVSIFLFGILVTQLRTETRFPNHLLHQKKLVSFYTGVISDFVVEKPNHYNVILRINQMRLASGWHASAGKIMLMMRKEAGLPKPRYGDVLLVKGKPDLPQPPLNPNAFNYRQYLAYQQIYHQQYVWPQQVKVIGYQPPFQMMALSIRLRNHLDSILKKYIPGQRNYAIATALVLGMKEYLDADIKAAYTRTGTTHVLAVSGLHVALLFLALNWILGKLARTPRQKLVVFLLLLGIMWLYAFVTALSASVLRAVVMFTLLSIGKFFKRRSNIYNILAGTAFALLVYNPFFILDVGFQLSFAAVVGIVFWQPRFSEWLQFDNWLSKKLWEGVTASLAAQLATAPLALYYFHQFPVYFLLANLFAVIISEFILYVGFILLALGFVPVLGQILGWVMGLLLDIMNTGVLVMEKLPFAIIDGISMSVVQAWLVAGFLLLISWFFIYRQRVFLLAASIALISSSVLQFAKITTRQQQQLWVVYNLKNTSGLAFIKGRQATLLTDSIVNIRKPEFTYNIQPHWWQLGIKDARYVSLQKPIYNELPTFNTPAGNSFYVWRGIRILIITQPEKFVLTQTSPLTIDYVVVKNNVKLNLTQIKQVFRFKSLIFDSSDKKWYRQRMQEVCAQQQIPFYDVSKEGAFIARW